MILWLKLLVILSAIMFLFWFILYVKPDIEQNVENEEDNRYRDITDEELNSRLKIAQRRLAVENLKNIEKTIKKLDKLSK